MASAKRWYGVARFSSLWPNSTHAPWSEMARAAWATRVVLPRPASPETSRISRPGGGGHPPVGVPHPIELGRTPHHPLAGPGLQSARHGNAGPASASQATSTVSTASGRPQAPEGRDGHSGAGYAGRRGSAPRRGQDLPPGGPRAEPSRLHHRVSEVVVVLGGHLPGAEAHPEAQ